MKKIYLALSVFFIFQTIKTSATIWDVNVANFAFTPNSLNVFVGDTIRWHWISGSHTTTSTSVPAGASAWNSSMNSTTTTFDYIITVAGNYSYVCSFHSSMVGTIVATSSSGINTPSAQVNFTISTMENSMFTFTYSLSKPTYVNLRLSDITGKLVRNFQSVMKSGGDYIETYDLSDLKNGIYLVQFISENQQITRRIIVQ